MAQAGAALGGRGGGAPAAATADDYSCGVGDVGERQGRRRRAVCNIKSKHNIIDYVVMSNKRKDLYRSIRLTTDMDKMDMKYFVDFPIYYIYYIDKIESLIVLMGVCGNGEAEYQVSYTTRISIMRRWSLAY